MAQTIANFAAILKEFYTPDRVAIMILESSPLLAMLPKKEFSGNDLKVPIIYGDTAGHSATFGTAQANKGQSTSQNFAITTATHYALGSIDRRVMLASKTNIGAFLPAARVNIDGAFRQIRRDLAIHAYRDGTGARGRVSAFAAGVITLTVAADAVNFSIGDVLRVDAVKTGTTPEAGTFTVTAIDTVAGTLTGTSAGGISIDANDWIFADGDKGQVMTGLASWIPPAAPSATAFFGMDRSVNPTMLAGVRSDGTGKLRYEALIDAQSDLMALGDGRPDYAFLHPNDFRALVKELEAQVMRPKYTDVEIPVRKDSNAVVGFSGIVIQGNSGVIECYADRFATPNQPYLLTMEDMGLAHIGPQVADLVGREEDEGMLVEVSSDGYEVRVAGYVQIYTRAPGHNAVITNFGL